MINFWTAGRGICEERGGGGGAFYTHSRTHATRHDSRGGGRACVRARWLCVWVSRGGHLSSEVCADSITGERREPNPNERPALSKDKGGNSPRQIIEWPDTAIPPPPPSVYSFSLASLSLSLSLSLFLYSLPLCFICARYIRRLYFQIPYDDLLFSCDSFSFLFFFFGKCDSSFPFSVRIYIYMYIFVHVFSLLGFFFLTVKKNCNAISNMVESFVFLNLEWSICYKW